MKWTRFAARVKDEGRLGRELWQLLRKVARNVPFAPDALAAWFCARDPATPTKVKAILLGAVAYFVLPLDVIPDVLPFLGFTDDAAVIGAALAAVRDRDQAGTSRSRPQGARRALTGNRFRRILARFMPFDGHSGCSSSRRCLIDPAEGRPVMSAPSPPGASLPGIASALLCRCLEAPEAGAKASASFLWRLVMRLLPAPATLQQKLYDSGACAIEIAAHVRDSGGFVDAQIDEKQSTIP